MDQSPLSPSHIVMVYDITKDRGVHEVRRTIDEVRMRGDILRRGDTLLVLGVLHKVPNPMGYMTADPDSFGGASARVMEEEVTKKFDMYTSMLLRSAEVCETEGVTIKVKIIAGSPMRHVIIQEALYYNAAWVILDRHLTKDSKFYLKQIPCWVALIQDNLSVVPKKSNSTNETDPIEHKSFYSLSRTVLPLNSQDAQIGEQTSISCSYSLSIYSNETSDVYKANSFPSSLHGLKEHNLPSYHRGSNKQQKSGPPQAIVGSILGEWNLLPTTRFFCVITKESLSQGTLSLPVAVTRHFHSTLPQSTTIIAGDGQRWNVTLVVLSQENAILHGVGNFFHHYILEQGTFLLCDFSNEFRVLNVKTFGLDAMEISYPKFYRDKETLLNFESHAPNFMKELKDYHFNKSVLVMPRAFAKQSGLDEANAAYLDFCGYINRVTIHRNKDRGRSFTLDLSDFLSMHHMKAGDVLVFEWMGDSTIRVHVYK